MDLEQGSPLYSDITFQEFLELMQECNYPYPNITDSLGGTRRLTFMVQSELLWFIWSFQPEMVHTWIITERNVN